MISTPRLPFRARLNIWLAFSISLFAASATAASVSLISSNSIWRHLDDGSDQGSAWRATGFDDSGWPTNRAPLGYGLSKITTTQAMARVTYYFRKQFTVTTPAAYSNLLIGLRRDDGGIVYLNDTEVFRSNMPTGAVNFRTLATLAATGPRQFTYHPQPVSASVLVPGVNQVAVEIHQAGTNSVDAAFDLELRASTDTSPPTIALTDLAGGVFIAGDNIPLGATAADDFGVAQVEFMVNGKLLSSASSPPYTATFGNVRYGLHTLSAVAQDLAGLRTTSAPVNINVTLDPGLVTLVPNQACWSYWDRGSDPGADWAGHSYDDVSWPLGYAELGYGDGDEVTEVGYGADADNKQITTYFRHSFNVKDPNVFTNLILRLKRDDGAVVYLNGVEIFRDNLPPDPLFPFTPASEASDDGAGYLTANISPDLLRENHNLLAIEVHQSSGTSPDISFDLRLLGKLGLKRPVLNITQGGPGTVLVSWSAATRNDFVLQRTTALSEAPSWETLPGPYASANEFREVSVAASTVSSFFRLGTANGEIPFCQPPLIITQPSAQKVQEGSTVTLSALVAGSEPLTFQWFHNTYPVPGALSPTLVLTNLQRTNGGSYDLCVSCPCGFAFTKPIALTVGGGAEITTPDAFATPYVLSGLNGTLNVDTASATAEPDEPSHAQEGPSHSVWFSYTAPVTGIVDLRTDGSSFDTVLAVYRGTSISALEPIAENDDGGLQFRSRVRFSTAEGQTYRIAIDGYDRRSGPAQLDWSIEAGDTITPIIFSHPRSLSVEEGGTATFSAGVRDYDSVQWFRGSEAIPGANSLTYTIPSVIPSDAGSYRVVATAGVNTVGSTHANLLVGLSTGSTIGFDSTTKRDKCDADYTPFAIFKDYNAPKPGCLSGTSPFFVNVYADNTKSMLASAKISYLPCLKLTWLPCTANCTQIGTTSGFGFFKIYLFYTIPTTGTKVYCAIENSCYFDATP